jgi:hypothetical protein
MEIEVVTKNKRKKKIFATKKAIAKLLIEIMREHIGMKNGISREELFKAVFGFYSDEINELQEVALWSILKSALHFLRQRTKCFVTNARTSDHDIEYFVVKDFSDAQCYSEIVHRITAQMKKMEKKSYRAVSEEWFLLEWTINDDD